jgi:hypothetical protein
MRDTDDTRSLFLSFSFESAPTPKSSKYVSVPRGFGLGGNFTGLPTYQEL